MEEDSLQEAVGSSLQWPAAIHEDGTTEVHVMVEQAGLPRPLVTTMSWPPKRFPNILCFPHTVETPLGQPPQGPE